MIIGICGLAGSGKSTVGAYLVHKYIYARRPFAYPLKCMIAQLGVGVELLDGPIAVKELPMEMFGGKTLRHAMQTLGGEWGRGQFGDEFWVNIWLRTRPDHQKIVADDVRYANEAAAIKRVGGIVVKVQRPGAGSKTGAQHPSENVGAVPCDLTLVNDGTKEELLAKVDGLMRDLSWGGDHGSISQTA